MMPGSAVKSFDQLCNYGPRLALIKPPHSPLVTYRPSVRDLSLHNYYRAESSVCHVKVRHVQPFTT